MSETKTMQAIRYHEYGGPDKLVLEQIPRPEPQPGTLLVRVKAAGVNPWDWKLRGGAYRQFMPVEFPYTPGIELAGVVEELGPEVSGFQRGQAVFGSAGGANAEYALSPAAGLAPKPASLSFDQAAAVPIGATTAWRALLDTANVQPGQRVLVQGAAGGVGMFAVQLARWRGAHVIGTASTRNLDFVRSFGANEVVDYTAGPIEKTVRDVDIVIDTVGGEVMERSLALLRPGGLLVTVAGQPPTAQAEARGVSAAGVGQGDPARVGEMLRQISALINSGQVKAPVTNVFPLAEAVRANALSETGHGQGRIVLHVAD